METAEATPEAPLQQLSIVERAQGIDARAVQLAAITRAAIVQIRAVARQVLELEVESGSVTEEEVGDVIAYLDERHGRRVSAIRGDTRAKVGFAPAGVAGFYDGKDIVITPDFLEDQGVYDHEKQHERDGLPENLDTPLVHREDVPIINERLKTVPDVIARALAERRAMEAAGEIPDAYRGTHWAVTEELRKRGERVGVDLEGAGDRVVTHGDREGFHAAVVEVAAREIAREDPDALEEVLAEEGKRPLRPEIHEILQRTQYQFRCGTPAAQARRNRTLVSAFSMH
jgi:hypothetical protein